MKNPSRPLWALIAFVLLSPVQTPAATDDTDLPFVDDPAVVGAWKSVAYVPAPDIELFAAKLVLGLDRPLRAALRRWPRPGRPGNLAGHRLRRALPPTMDIRS